jgi:hypothetical protein
MKVSTRIAAADNRSEQNGDYLSEANDARQDNIR